MPSLRTLFYRTLLLSGLALAAPAVQAAPIEAGELFQSSGRHVRYGAEERTLRDEAARPTARLAGAGKHRYARFPRGEAAVPEPGAALLFGLGALAVTASRRRA
jgi:hypothetical protein